VSTLRGQARQLKGGVRGEGLRLGRRQKSTSAGNRGKHKYRQNAVRWISGGVWLKYVRAKEKTTKKKKL